MGAALARCLHDAGHDPTVWNRSPDKMTPFLRSGIAGAASIGAAVSASPVAPICIDNYRVSDALLQANDVVPNQTGRIIVQLSTGTPDEARQASKWVAAEGAHYLDGAILADRMTSAPMRRRSCCPGTGRPMTRRG